MSPWKGCVAYAAKGVDYAEGGGNATTPREENHTVQLHARLPPRNLLSCTFPLDRISSSRLLRLLNQHVGGSLKKVLPAFSRRGDGAGDTRRVCGHAGSAGADGGGFLLFRRCSPSVAVLSAASLIEILCGVQHAAALLIRALSQRGRRLDHFLSAPKWDDFSVGCMSCWKACGRYGEHE